MITIEERLAMYEYFKELGEKAAAEHENTKGKTGNSVEETAQIIAQESHAAGKAVAFFKVAAIVVSDEFPQIMERMLIQRKEAEQKAN